jgi:hypothetical protein
MAQEDLSPLSPELQAAQARLRQLRAERGIQPRDTSRDLTGWRTGVRAKSVRSEATNWPMLNAQKELERRRGSVRSGHFSAVLGGALDSPQPSPQTATADRPPLTGAEVEAGTRPAQTVIVHPTILLTILKQDLEAPARVWLLLRAIDAEGRGCLSVEEARRRLAEKDSPLHICGWRRLRQLLREGEGVFWHRDDRDRLWLHGAHKIAYKLDCDRLQGFPIELPIQALLGGIQAVRAAFYATFHGGRDSKPISRETLRAVSGIAERTQRVYDRLAPVERRHNIAIGERYSQDRIQERAWEKGRAVFHFVDTRGLQGRAGRGYIAWHLPNSYQTAYQRCSRGSRKRLNRKLADLVQQGIPGNDDRAVERLFFPNGALAAKRYNRDPEDDAYWPQDQMAQAGTGVWRVIDGLKKNPVT